MMNLTKPSHDHKLYTVCHQHEYGSTQWLLWSKVFPNEEQIIRTLGINFEPEKDEFILIEEITAVHILKLP